MEKKVIIAAATCVIVVIAIILSFVYMVGWDNLLLEFGTPTKMLTPWKIPSGAMSPTLKPGDKIFTIKFIGSPNPQRGDVVVFNYPEDKTKKFVKRVIGLPGETLEIKNGKVLINGKPIPSKFHYYNRGDFSNRGYKVRIPEDSYYVLGDNSNSSRDSRYFGPVHREDIIAKAARIYWPIRRIGNIE